MELVRFLLIDFFRPMLSLRDAVSILPQTSLVAATTAAAVVANNTTSTGTTTTPLATDYSFDSNNGLDASAKFLISVLPTFVADTNSVRTLHALLVAANVFWYQSIRQTVAVMSVFMCKEFADYGMDTSQQAQLIAAPSVGNIVTQALGGLIIRCLPGGTKTAITIALIGLAT